MSVIQFPETLSSQDVQIWDNAAFDNGEFEGAAAIKVSWSSVKPVSINLSQSLESSSTKENLSPSMVEMELPVSTKSSASVKPLLANRTITNTQRTPLSKAGISGRKIPKSANESCAVKESIPVERNLDSEIEEIEKEINRLSSRLESLRLEQARRNAKSMEKRGKIVAAKFKDPPKQSVKACDEQCKIEDSVCVSAKLNMARRGCVGPAEIMRGERRGISLGPVEIYSAAKLKQLGKQDITTPAPSPSSRRKSCYWKPQNIDELRVAKERGKSFTVSPKYRAKTASKLQAPKQGATTIGSKKALKKEDGIISSIQPKKLFTKDSEKSAPAKKPLKDGRVVASRYSQISNGANSAKKELRKRSLPENEEYSTKSGRKRVSLAGDFQGAVLVAVEKGVDKQLEITSEAAIQKNLVRKAPLSVSKMLGRVPNVKTFRYTEESPSNSGPPKGAYELVGKKSCFGMDKSDDDVEESFCHGLNFAEEQITAECLKIRLHHCSDKSPRDSGLAKNVSQLVGSKSLLNDDDDDMHVFSFEEENGEEN